MSVGAAVDLIGYHSPGSAAQAQAILEVRQGASTLRQMLAAVRMLVDGTGGMPEVQSVRISDFVSSMLADPFLMGRGDADRVRVEVRGKVGTWQICPLLMLTTLGNLLRNALRYSPPDSLVKLVIGEREGRQWMHVMNRGRRIPREIQADIFKPGVKHEQGGMGLGLYIAQTSIQRMGARLFMGSTDACTVFSIVLPAGSSLLDEPEEARHSYASR
jgi:signal transduction histidine kinase